MTVQQAIERANEMRAGNSATDELKIKWLSEIDHIIYNDVIMTHWRYAYFETVEALPEKGKSGVVYLVSQGETGEYDKYVYSNGKYAKVGVFSGDLHDCCNRLEFNEYADGSAELIAKAPYDVLYVYWLMAQIDLKASELNKYNNSLALFKEAFKDYKAWYNRTHMPITKKQIRLCIDGGV